MIERAFFVTDEEMTAEIEDYMDGRPVSFFIGAIVSSVYEDYSGWCEREGRIRLTRRQFGRAFSILNGTTSVPRWVRGRSARVIELKSTIEERRARKRREKCPEEGISFGTWERLSYERVDDYIRETCTFEGMTYQEIYDEYSGWCGDRSYVPLPYSRFTSVFGRKWQRLDGYTLVERRNGKSTRIVHDPLPE